nr:MAG TPA: hypothetical protein [Caudoviricetes sp.]
MSLILYYWYKDIGCCHLVSKCRNWVSVGKVPGPLIE